MGKKRCRHLAQLTTAALVLISCSHMETTPSAAAALHVSSSLVPEIPSVQPTTVQLEEIPIEEALPDLLPAGCRWNLTGTYAVANPFSKRSAALRYEVWDDGTTLTITPPAPSDDPPKSSRENADSPMEFVRTREGFLHRTLKRITVDGTEGDAAAICEVPFSAKIIDCDRTHLLIEMDRTVGVDANCVVAERESPDNLRLVRAHFAVLR